MGKFILLSFLVLGLGFYEMSGGSDFEPELRAPVEVAETQLAPVEPAPQVTRSDTTTASLIQIALPAAQVPEVATPVSLSLPAGEVRITPAPDLVEEAVVEVVATPEPVIAADLRAVAGDWVNMRSGPSTNFDVLNTLPRGTQAEVMEVDADGWARIKLAETGQIGWMAERLLSEI